MLLTLKNYDFDDCDKSDTEGIDNRNHLDIFDFNAGDNDNDTHRGGSAP